METKKLFKQVIKAKNPWKESCKYQLERGGETLEPGVNFFVLALEYLGAETLFSCEGHPKGFYIQFRSSYDTALKINSLKYFSVKLFDMDVWKISRNEYGFEAEKCRNYQDGDRV